MAGPDGCVANSLAQRSEERRVGKECTPLQRAAETAKIIAHKLPALHPEPSPLLFDCVPSGPGPDTPTAYAPFFGSYSELDFEAGQAQMADARAEFLSSHREDRHDLLITHNFVIGWIVREVLQAPEWRWMTLNQAHCGLTVIAQKQGRPWTLLSHNDLAHLPVELRTGLPEVYPV